LSRAKKIEAEAARIPFLEAELATAIQKLARLQNLQMEKT
jgi:hypothetical protein